MDRRMKRFTIALLGSRRGGTGSMATAEGRRRARRICVLFPAILLGIVLVSACSSSRLEPRTFSSMSTCSAVPGKPTITSALGRAYSVDLVCTIAPVTPDRPIYFVLMRGASAGSCYHWVCTKGFYGCPETITFQDTGLSSGATYFYQVYAYNDDGTGQRSDAVSVTTAFLPTEPQELTASGGNSQVSLHWTGPASSGTYPITNYKIYRGTTPGSEVYFTTVGNQWSWTDTGVGNGYWYYYKVTAVSFAGDSAMSNEASARPVGPPRAPRNLAARAMNSAGDLSWDIPTSDGGLPITNYTIYRRTAFTESMPVATIGNETRYIDAELANGEIYFYKIKAINSAGEGFATDERWLRPGMPTDVMSLSATGGYGRIVLSWEAPRLDGGSPITSYRIYRGTSSASEIVIAEIGNVTTYTDSSVAIDQEYYYRVSAVNGIMEGDLSTRVSARATQDPAIFLWIFSIPVIVGILSPLKKRKRCHQDGSRQLLAQIPARGDIKKTPEEKRKERQRASDAIEALGPVQLVPLPIKKSAAAKRAVTANTGGAVAPGPPAKAQKPAPSSCSQPKDKSSYLDRPHEKATPVNRTVLKEYVERKRKEGVRELHYIGIKNDLNIISQKKSSKLYRILQDLVRDEILVRKGSTYVIVGK